MSKNIIRDADTKTARGLALILAGCDKPMTRELLLSVTATTPSETKLRLAAQAVEISRYYGGMKGNDAANRAVLKVLLENEQTEVPKAIELRRVLRQEIGE